MRYKYDLIARYIEDNNLDPDDYKREYSALLDDSTLTVVWGDIPLTKPTQAQLQTIEDTMMGEEQAAYKALAWKRARIAAYREKGWNTPWDYIDDQIKRGVDVVNNEKKAIKTNIPKTHEL